MSKFIVKPVKRSDSVIEYHFYFYKNDHLKKINIGEACSFLINESDEFRIYCSELMKNVPYAGFMFAITKIHDLRKDLDKDFIIYVKSNPVFARMKADPSAYSEHFRGKWRWKDIPNLSGDALLLIPNKPKGGNYDKYANISNFFKEASISEISELFKAIGIFLEDSINFDCVRLLPGNKKHSLYINTHGLGVPWIHVRFDTNPKYVYWV
jgi:hypothetical protein